MSDCLNLPVLYTGLQLSLLALLPKDGTRVSVAALAESAGVGAQDVVDELAHLYLAHTVDYDVRSDSFSLPAPQVPA